MTSINVGKWRDTYNELKDAKEQLGLGEPPPSGLVPIGDLGLYGTPDEPASPFDCERYPDSVYCGGNPLSSKFIDLEVETTVQVNPCGTTRSATFKGTIGHIKLPKHTIAHIPPNCREEYERQGEQTPPPPPPADMDGYKPTPQYAPYGFDSNAICCIVTKDQYFEETQEFNWVAKDWRIATYQLMGSADEIEYPSDDMIPYYNSNNGIGLVQAVASVKGAAIGHTRLNREWMRDYWNKNEELNTPINIGINLSFPPDFPTQAERSSKSISNGNYKVIVYFPTGRPGLNTLGLYIGRFGDIFPKRQISPIINSDYTSPDGKYRKKVIHETFVLYCQKISGDSSDRLPPPLKEPPKECCDMGCCQPPYGSRQQQDNNEIKQLLRRIDKKLGEFPIQVTVFDANEDKRGAQRKVEKPSSVASSIKLAIERNEKLAKILGIDLLPITVPKTVIEKKGAGIFEQIFGFLDFNKNEEINSILEMQTWMFQQMSGILGHWMMEIPVEDNDPLKAGNQDKDGKTKDEKDKKPENVILPNIALTMREQVAMQIQTLKALGMLVDMQIKSLIDLAGTKVLSAECAARLEDLQLYFDYETEEVVEDLPLQITFPDLKGKREDVENLAKFLKEGTTKVSYDKWTVQKSQSLEEKIIQLLEMSSAIRALYFHNGA